MEKNISILGPKEAEFLSIVSAHNKQGFGINTAIQYWGSREIAKKKLYQLEKKGWVARIERGKYLVIPLEAGPTRQWSEDSYLIAAALVHPAVIAYWSAIRHWNWTEQFPRILYVQTTQRKKYNDRTVFGVKYEFITVNRRKFYGNVKEWRSGIPVLVTDKEKTLIDCADDVERAGSIEELLKAVKASVAEISWQRLHGYISRFPNGAVKKRLGYLFEKLIPNLSEEARDILEKWQQSLSAGIVPLQPSGRKSGKIVTRWRILVNAEVR